MARIKKKQTKAKIDRKLSLPVSIAVLIIIIAVVGTVLGWQYYQMTQDEMSTRQAIQNLYNWSRPSKSLAIMVGVEDNDSWQGVYCPEGDLLDEDTWSYSQKFASYGECKTWLLEQKSELSDRYACGLNCQMDFQKCETVVSNSDFVSGSVGFQEHDKTLK